MKGGGGVLEGLTYALVRSLLLVHAASHQGQRTHRLDRDVSFTHSYCRTLMCSNGLKTDVFVISEAETDLPVRGFPIHQGAHKRETRGERHTSVTHTDTSKYKRDTVTGMGR